MKSSGKIILSIAAILFLAVSLRLASPEIPNPSATVEFAGPDSITMIFKRACYDCHSNETRLAWYDKFAPISWKIAADVTTARERFNFSHWDSLFCGRSANNALVHRQYDRAGQNAAQKLRCPSCFGQSIKG